MGPTGTCSGVAEPLALVAREAILEVLALLASVLTAVSSRESALMKWGCSRTWGVGERGGQQSLGGGGGGHWEPPDPWPWAYRHWLDLGRNGLGGGGGGGQELLGCHALHGAGQCHGLAWLRGGQGAWQGLTRTPRLHGWAWSRGQRYRTPQHQPTPGSPIPQGRIPLLQQESPCNKPPPREPQTLPPTPPPPRTPKSSPEKLCWFW